MTMWKHWTLPKNEGTRLHEFGTSRICVAVDTAGEGDILAAMPIYPDIAAVTKPTGRKPGLSLPPLTDSSWIRYYMGKDDGYRLAPAYPPLPKWRRFRCSGRSRRFTARLTPASSADTTRLNSWLHVNR